MSCEAGFSKENTCEPERELPILSLLATSLELQATTTLEGISIAEEHEMNPLPKDMPLLEVKQGNIVLFHPHISERVRQFVNDTLHTRWIGEGPRVEEFEEGSAKGSLKGGFR